MEIYPFDMDTNIEFKDIPVVIADNSDEFERQIKSITSKLNDNEDVIIVRKYIAKLIVTKITS